MSPIDFFAPGLVALVGAGFIVLLFSAGTNECHTDGECGDRRMPANTEVDTPEMPASDFNAWAEHMAVSEREIARRLGCSRTSIRKWREAGAPPYIALACAALAFGLPPWREGKPLNRAGRD
jgi:hypothetical protein